MDTLTKDFFEAWEEEIAAYQEVALALTEQKHALTRWDIRQFHAVTQKAALLIGKAHRTTNDRQDLLDSLFLLRHSKSEPSLRTVGELLGRDEEKEKVRVFFKVFSNTLKSIDNLSKENKELIRTGLELVGENLEMIADIIDHDRVYSRGGMMQPKKSSIILNKRV